MSRAPRLLLVEVSRSYCDVFSEWARENGIEVVACDRRSFRAHLSDSILCIYQATHTSEIVHTACELVCDARATPLVILSPKMSIPEVAQLIGAGVRDVIPVPAAADEVLARVAPRARNVAAESSSQRLIGESPLIRKVRCEIHAVAPLDSTVLISGETGTGKGVAASLLHELSPRRRRAFVHADCSALSTPLIDSELFGHERGAFTGAVTSRAGRLEIAAGGTLFLDEIGELSLGLQAKLLRVLQDRIYERVGSGQSRSMSARVVAATSRDLEAEVANGRFRRDLYFRLNVVRIEMPALRDRLSDLASIVPCLLERLSLRLGVDTPPLPERFIQDLSQHDWPGNVRELINVLERFLVRHNAGLPSQEPWGTPRDDRSPSWRQIGSPHGAPFDSSGMDERQYLEQELAAAGGNVSKLARKLGVARGTLRYRISRHKNLDRRSSTISSHDSQD